jgi:hypothetical protein
MAKASKRTQWLWATPFISLILANSGFAFFAMASRDKRASEFEFHGLCWAIPSVLTMIVMAWMGYVRGNL